MTVDISRAVVMPFGNVIISVIIFDILFTIYCLYVWFTDKSMRGVPLRNRTPLARFLRKYGFLIFAFVLEVIISLVVIGDYVLRYIPILGW